jgi:uncharacterized Fe-S center protein
MKRIANIQKSELKNIWAKIKQGARCTISLQTVMTNRSKGRCWSIADRVKERRSVINDYRIFRQGWNVAAEGFRSVSPVEFKVTARHAMRGSGSTEINVREGGTNLDVAMDHDGVSVQQRVGGDIISSNVIASLSPVEFKVTACHTMHGSGSTEIDVRDGGTISQVMMNVNDMSEESRVLGVTSSVVATLFRLCLLLSSRSRLAMPCVGAAALRSTLGRLA